MEQEAMGMVEIMHGELRKQTGGEG
jgi:hypothetical protein